MKKTIFFYWEKNMKIGAKKVLLNIEYALSTVIETIFILYVPNIYLREVILLDIFFSLFYHFHTYLFYTVQLMNCICFITLLFFYSLRAYSLFWFYIIFKNECRAFLIQETQEKKEPLLKNMDIVEDTCETATIISV